jgi:hypothetical protein
MSSSLPLLIYLAIAGILGLIALSFIAWALVIWSRARAARHWHSVLGTVVTSEVVEASDGGDASLNSFYAHVTYAYQVAGHGYQGTRLHLGRTGGARKHGAEQVVAAHAPGSPVQVYYNPADPGQAALSREPGGARGLVTIALVLLVLAAVLYPLIVQVFPWL